MNLLNSEQAAAILLGGGVGVIATDTVYGVVACAADESAVARLYDLKQRENKPGTIIAANIQQLIDLGADGATLRRIAYLWPNPVSIVVPTAEHLRYLHQEWASLPMRIPKDEQLRAFLEQTGPLMTSSANQPGEPPANTPKEAYAYFGDDVDFYVDGGDRTGSPSSTLLRLQGEGFEVLRQGAFVLEPGRQTPQ